MPDFEGLSQASTEQTIEQDGRGVSGVAPVAMQMGTHVGRTIRADIAGRARKPFRYVNKGLLATIGRGAAGNGSKAPRNTPWDAKINCC